MHIIMPKRFSIVKGYFCHWRNLVGLGEDPANPTGTKVSLPAKDVAFERKKSVAPHTLL